MGLIGEGIFDNFFFVIGDAVGDIEVVSETDLAGILGDAFVEVAIAADVVVGDDDIDLIDNALAETFGAHVDVIAHLEGDALDEFGFLC